MKKLLSILGAIGLIAPTAGVCYGIYYWIDLEIREKESRIKRNDNWGDIHVKHETEEKDYQFVYVQ